MSEKVLGFKEWCDNVLCNTEIKCPACNEVLHFLESVKKAGFVVYRKDEVVSLECVDKKCKGEQYANPVGKFRAGYNQALTDLLLAVKKESRKEAKE